MSKGIVVLQAECKGTKKTCANAISAVSYTHLDVYKRQRLSSKPLDMPKKITIDVSDMDINDTVNMADLQLPANVTRCV